ncbi:hypothetical protein [Psychrobacillus soli]|uniref:Uncharacterized protein n=1 Tax=Psychrobacillus soli TaxID=1543965 RepID=A0A544SL66_9BACI|nr:hypothetical protein [Psychrobacillus soli]TQR05958.1 hypothetical protein FG383_19360 [Psychrobacillus soli]
MAKRIISYKVRKGIFKLVVLIVGILAFLPSHLLETNIQNIEDGRTKDFAAYALETTAATISNTVDQLLIVSYEIESIEKVDGEPLSSVIVAYTAFGLPYAEIIADENGAYINKKLLFQK